MNTRRLCLLRQVNTYHNFAQRKHLNSIGSLSMGAPGGTVTDALPPKVKAWSDSGTTADAFAESATCAEPILREVVPNAFENLMRRRSPPMVGRTTMRMVWFWIRGKAEALEMVVERVRRCSRH